MSDTRKLLLLLSFFLAAPSTQGATFDPDEVMKLAYTSKLDIDALNGWAFSTDGTQFAYAVNRDVRILSLKKPEPERSFAVSGEISSIALTSGGEYCVVALLNGQIVVWEVLSGQERFRHELADEAVDQMFLDAKDEWLLVVDSKGVAIQVPLLGGKERRQPINPLHSSTLAMDASADGRRLVTSFGPQGTLTMGFFVPREGDPIQFPTSFGGHVNQAEKLTYGQNAVVAIQGRQWRWLHHPMGWKASMNLAKGYLPLKKVLAAKLDSSDAVLVVAGSRGRVSLIPPGIFLKPSVLQLPIDTKSLDVDAACISPDCRTVAVCHAGTLNLYQFGSAPLFNQMQTARIAEQLLLKGRFKDLEEHLAEIPEEENNLFLECEALLKGRHLSSENLPRRDLLVSWIKQSPTEVMPRLVLADMEMALAWKIRGTGYASTVTEEMNQGFKEHVLAAVEYLADYVPNETTRSEYYLQQLSILTSLGPEFQRFKETTDSLMKFRPTALDAHIAAITHLMPRWHGRSGDGAVYAERVADSIDGPAGEAMYVNLAAAMLRYYKPAEYFERTQFRPERIFAVLDEQHKIRHTLPVEKKDHSDQLFVRFSQSNGDADAVITRVKMMLFTGWQERNRSKQKTHDAVMRAFKWARDAGGEGDQKAIHKEIERFMPRLPNGNDGRK